jgi:hypothetical protein
MNRTLTELVTTTQSEQRQHEIETNLVCPVSGQKITEGFNFSTLTTRSDADCLIKSITKQCNALGLRVVIADSKTSSSEVYVSFRCELYDVEQDEKRVNTGVRKPKKEKTRKTSQSRRGGCIKVCACPFHLRLALSTSRGCWRVTKYNKTHVGHFESRHVVDELDDKAIERIIGDRLTHGISAASVSYTFP